MVEVTVRFFATLRDRAGLESARIKLPDTAATVPALLDQIADMFPATAPALPTAIVAVNHEYVFGEHILGDGDEVALFPPVSGGNDNTWPEYFAITEDELDIDAIIATITRPETGAICTFTGAVRSLTRGQIHTDHLIYEAYSPMAEKKLQQVAREIRERFPLVQGIAIVQRIGRLVAGEVTVLVACASAHRRDGIFEAALYGVDRLKEIVPVWKKEVGPSGTTWVEGHYHPTPEDTLK